MHLIQILLPIYDNDQRPFDRALFDETQRELARSFGGVTAWLRSPAQGTWKKEGGETDYDQVVIVEVMAEELDRDWWDDYRKRLEARFRQEKIVARASAIELL